MASSAETVLPHDWKPRPYQRPLWEYLADGGKRAVAVWHRRAGKDALCLHHTACSAFERAGNYWHMLPEAAQVRKAIWDAVDSRSGQRRIDAAFPHSLREATREHEMLLKFTNASTWQCVGSDNFNSLIGASTVGIVWSEWSVADPSSWAYLSPILTENEGWAVFAYTPRGENHGLALFESAKESSGWFCQMLTVDDTGIFSQSQLDAAESELVGIHGKDIGRAMFEQEYYCSFAGPALGAIYAAELDRAEHDGRIRDVPHDPALPVYTAWDLGHSDATAIWWFQVGMDGVRLIDWHEASLHGLDYYAGVVLGRKVAQSTDDGKLRLVAGAPDPAHVHRVGYRYGGHYLPPDARQQRLDSAGRSIEQQLASVLPGVQIVNVPNDYIQCIQVTRAMFPRLFFDRARTKDARARLRQYRYHYDERLKMQSARPIHDWTSHTATALHCAAFAWRPITSSRPKAAVRPSVSGSDGWMAA